MGKYFDLCCTAIEKTPILKDVQFGDRPLRMFVRSIPLFEIPVATHKDNIIPKEYSSKDIEFLKETFFLPFPAIVVEDKAGCVFLEDIKADQKGIGEKRRFMTFSHSAAMGSVVMPPVERLRLLQSIKVRGHEMTFSIGEVELSVDDEQTFGGKVGLEAVYGCLENGEGIKQNENDPGNAEVAGRWVFAAYQEIFLINTPSRFVFKEEPADLSKKYKDADKSKKILRSDDRPRYTLLTPTEIKTKFGLGSTGTDVTGTNRAPHLRRRHYRTLRSEVFSPEKRGTTIIIPACWVGDSEKEANGKKYKVMLDL